MKTIVKLSNGLLVANFSNVNDYIFEDGTIVPKVDKDLAEELKITIREKVVRSDKTRHIADVKQDFKINKEFLEEVKVWISLYKNKEVDIVLVSNLVLQCLRLGGWNETDLINSPFRAVKLSDTTHKLIKINRFSI